MTIASLMNLTFILGHKYISDLTTFNLQQYIRQYLSYYIQTWHGGRPMHRQGPGIMTKVIFNFSGDAKKWISDLGCFFHVTYDILSYW